MSGVRLLFVEDVPDDVALAEAELRREGVTFESHAVADRKSLIEALNGSTWSAVISDYNLPGFSGTEALRIVREHDADLPFIVLSGTIGEERAAEAIRAGSNDYVMKDNLVRLAPVVRREIREAKTRVERKQLEQHLRRAEDRYRQTFEHAPIGILTIDPTGVIVNANQAYCAIIGRSSAELIGRHFTVLLHPEDVPAGTARFEQRLRDLTGVISYERGFRRPDGSTVWTNLTLSAIPNAEGKVESVIALAQEITEKKLAEEKFNMQGEQLAEAQKIANLGSWDHDLRTGRVTWSDQMCRMHGFEPGTVPDMTLASSMIHPDDRESIESVQATARAAKRPFSTEFRLVRPDGIHTIHTRGRVVLDQAGNAIRILGIVQDITDRVAREEELRRVAVQQAAVANLGQTALSGMTLDFLLVQTAMFVAAVLDVEFCEVLRKTNGHLALVAGEGWAEGSIGAVKVAGGRGSQAAYTIDSGQPVVVTDLSEENRFVPSELIVNHDIVSGITVAIESGEGNPWGVLGAYSRSRRVFNSSDIDFMRSVATIVGQAIDRERADNQLHARAMQQSAIAKLGHAALVSFDDGTLARACELVRRSLAVDYSVFAETSADRKSLRYRAGRWDSRLPAEIPVAPDSHAGLTVTTAAPVVVSDYSSDGRLATGATAVSAGIVSGIAVPVASGSTIFGVLTAHTRIRREFSPADVDFMQSLANILAEAMERDRAQRELMESEERYRSVVEGASEIIFTIAADGTISTLNRAFETVTGWSREEWTGREFAELIDASDRERLMKLFAGMFETLSPMTVEASIIGRGKVVLLEVDSFPLIRDGKLGGVYGFGRDVTVARRVERERQELTRSLQLVLESTVEGIYTMDVEGRCTMINSAAARMLGRIPEEFLGRNMHELVHQRKADGSPHYLDECPIFSVLRHPAPRNVTNDVLWHMNGTAFPVDYSAAPIIDEGVAVGAVIAFTDISERRKLELKLEQANRLSSLGRLAATIAHEFNNVLMGIAPFIDVMRRQPQRAESALEQISRSVTRGKGITQDILRFTQPAEPHRSVFDVEPWLQDVAMEARSILSSGYTLDVFVEDPSLAVDADANQLHQIMMNVILNARDAMPNGGRLRIAAGRDPATARFPFGAIENPNRFVHFLVSDTGIGMSSETLHHIFEPLYTTKRNGTGLGLAVTHQVILRHGGEIFAESEIGAGTTFHMFLPVADRATESMLRIEGAGEAPCEYEYAPSEPASARVLLVEDDEAVASGLTALLAFEGLHVDVVGTGAEALAYVARTDVDVVILDVGLPDMDGTQVYALMSESHPDLPVIVSTGHADRARLDELSPGRTVHYLLKPYDADILLETITRALDGQRLRSLGHQTS